MKTVSTMFRNIEDIKELMQKPKWVIGFKYIFLDEADDVDLDLLFLMRHFGYTEAYELCSSYYKKFPNSIAMPVHQNIDSFFFHLQEIGIFKKDTPVGALEQCESTRAVHEAIITPTD